MVAFGVIYQKIMRDPDLSIEAKAAYAYLSTMAGKDHKCFPSVETIQKELNIGKNRLQRCISELKDKGIITVERERNGNRWGRNIYNIQQPQYEAVEIEELHPEAVQNEAIQKPRNRPQLQNEAVETEELQNDAHNNNSIKQINNIANEYRSLCIDLPQLNRVTQADKKAIAASIKAGYKLEDFQKVFRLAERSSFLKGETGGSWKAGFSWLIKAENMEKVLSLRYQDGGDTDETDTLREAHRALDRQLEEWAASLQ